MESMHETVKQENIKVYSAEAATYDRAHPEVWNWYEQGRYRRLVAQTLSGLDSSDPVVVDIGAGTGNLSLKYLAAGCRVVSVDISREMLDRLESKLTTEQSRRATLVRSDAESAVQSLDSFDGVCFSSVLHHIYDYKALVAEVMARLNPGGFFFDIHDPLIQKPRSRVRFRLHRLLGRLDEGLYRWNMRRQGVALDAFPDDTLAEYHQSSGSFSHQELIRTLEQGGLTLEHFETYTSRRYGLCGWLASEVIGSENSFALIGRKA